MKKIILVALIALGTLQAGSVVHYDIRADKPKPLTKPNHPSTELYR